MRITKNPEERKQEILDTALLLFEEQGVAKTSMKDIAERMQVAKGLLYYYFASKEELIIQVVDAFTKEVEGEILKIVAHGQLGFHEKLRALIRVFFQAIQEYPSLMSLGPGNPGIFEFVKTRLSELAMVHAESLLGQGVEEGHLALAYPNYMLKILIHGIADLFVEGITEETIHLTLIEEALGLDKGSLRYDKPL